MNEVLRFLKENSVMRIATASADGKPRASIVEYGMVGNSMIFATHHGSIKDANIAANPLVSLSVGAAPTYLTIDGAATDASPDEIEAFNKILFDRHLLGARPQIYTGHYTRSYDKYPEFREMIRSGDLNMKYYRVVFYTAYYTHGLGPARIVEMR